jgi:RimJ/RimL family protein N-acetyltransferase
MQPTRKRRTPPAIPNFAQVGQTGAGFAASHYDAASSRSEPALLRGTRVGLRARHESDVLVLQAELYDDVSVRVRADSRPWRPLPPVAATSPYRAADPKDDVAVFSVVEMDDGGSLAGEALLWGIDTHNRCAHIGISLRPAYRGRALGSDVVNVLCRYGFDIRGLNRLQVETLSDNAAMIAAAKKSGFVVEGVLRGSAWVEGRFMDETILGLLVDDWSSR